MDVMFYLQNYTELKKGLRGLGGNWKFARLKVALSSEERL